MHKLFSFTALFIALMLFTPVETNAEEAAVAEASKDPVYEICMKGPFQKVYYDCECMGQKAQEEYRQKVAEAGAEAENAQAAHVKKNLEAIKRIKPVSDQHQKALEIKIMGFEKQLADLGIKSGGDVSDDEIKNLIVNEGLCKNAPAVKEASIKECMKSAHRSTPAGQTAEGYCECVGNKAAEMWLSEAQPLDSGKIVSIGAMARQACRS